MSIFKNIVGGFSKGIKGIAGTALTGLGGLLGGGGIGATVSMLPKVAGTLPKIGRAVLPGVGSVAGGAIGGMIAGGVGGGGRPRRRGRGFSARDIRQTRRMLALVRDVEKSCPTRRRSSAPRRVCR